MQGDVMQNDEVMTEEEAAKFLRVTPRTLLTLRKKGKILAGRIGRQYRYKRSYLDKLLSGELPKEG